MKTVFGVGICDTTYVKEEPYYARWADMLRRCYDPKYVKRFPTYGVCSVCEEWKLFSNFRSWMIQQDWEGCVLDKDLLIAGNKMYSPETCCFIPCGINSFLTFTRRGSKSGFIGASYQTTAKQSNKWIASCSQLNGKNKTLGRFDNPLEAHLAWCNFKADLALKLCGTTQDSKVVTSLHNLARRLKLCVQTKTQFTN